MVSMQTARVPVVADGHLGLAVGAQVGHLPGLAHRGELLGQPVRQVDRQRHELGGVGAGEAEHEALVAGALPVQRVAGALDALLERVVDALGDVRRTAGRSRPSTPQDSPSKPFSEWS